MKLADNYIKSLFFLLFLGLWPAWALAQEATPPDHVQIYKRAVTALNQAEKKLAGNFTAEAKSLIKEAKSLFAILQKEMPADRREQELTPTQEEQYNANVKMAEDSTAQGQRFEKTAEEKQKRGDRLEAQGQMEAAAQVQREVLRDLNLAQKAHLRAAIHHLRNMQLTFSYLNK
jgi:hypothetical protein